MLDRVKWIGADNGWKTGLVVVIDGEPVERDGRLLVRHSCTGELELVPVAELSKWPERSEWEVVT